jgi:hypothetical protein
VSVVLVSLLVAGGAGALYARQQINKLGPLPHGQVLSVADASAIERVPLPSKLEQKLHETVKQYLDSSKDKTIDRAGGPGACMDLGLFYLENGRLDEAKELFARLAQMKDPAAYPLIGQVGGAIVAALNNDEGGSNKLFTQVFTPAGKDKTAKMGPRLANFMEMTQFAPIRPLLENPRWRFWLAQARWYNRANGVLEPEVAAYLAFRFPVYDLPRGTPWLGPIKRVRPRDEKSKKPEDKK